MPFPVRTWQDVVAIAKFFNGKNWDATDPEPDTGVVMHFRVNEQGMFHFMSLSAPFVVIGGEKVDRGTNNYWFDPATMEPMINQPGHVRALEVLYELSQCGPPAQSAWDLGTAWDWFLRGKAIFVFSWGDVGALVQDKDRSKIKGKLGMRASTEAYALYGARLARQRFGATWALGETGATGPTGNRYGDAAGHTCIAVVGPTDHVITLETGKSDRVANMRAFSAAALDLLLKALGGPN